MEQCRICHRFGHQETCTTQLQHFVWKYGGKDISLFGEWSYFQIPIHLKSMENNPHQYETFVQLYPKTYRYKFNVDGAWMIDPEKPQIENNLGTKDNIIKVFPAVYEMSEEESDQNQTIHILDNKGINIKIKTQLKGTSHIIKGSWDNWQQEITVKNGSVRLKVLPGIYQFKFIVDGQWVSDDQLMTQDDNQGGLNNIIKEKIKHQSNFDINNLKWQQIKMDGLNFCSIQGHSLTCIGQQIYVFGGFYHGKFLNTTYAIDIEQQEVNCPNFSGNIPEERAYHHSIQFGNKIIIFGGLNQNQVFNDYIVFNTLSKVWNKYCLTGDVPTPRENFSLNKINNDILILYGGYECSEDETIEINYQQIYQLDLVKMAWTEINVSSNNLKARSSHIGFSLKQKVIYFGGVERETCMPKNVYNDVQIFNYEDKNLLDITKQIKGNQPEERYGHSGIEVQNYFLIYGGKTKNGKLLNDVWILDYQKLQWIQPNIGGIDPGARWMHSFCVTDKDEVYMLGGSKGKFVERKDCIYKLSFVQNQ